MPIGHLSETGQLFGKCALVNACYQYTREYIEQQAYVSLFIWVVWNMLALYLRSIPFLVLNEANPLRLGPHFAPCSIVIGSLFRVFDLRLRVSINEMHDHSLLPPPH